jgi:hypothetical protein
LETSSGKSLVCLAQLSGMSVSSVWDATKEQQFYKLWHIVNQDGILWTGTFIEMRVKK